MKRSELKEIIKEEIQKIKEAKQGSDLYFLIDQLTNSMEFYDEKEFVNHISKETNYSPATLKKIFNAYWKLDTKKFNMNFDFEKWLSKFGVK